MMYMVSECDLRVLLGCVFRQVPANNPFGGCMSLAMGYVVELWDLAHYSFFGIWAFVFSGLMWLAGLRSIAETERTPFRVPRAPIRPAFQARSMVTFPKSLLFHLPLSVSGDVEA